MASRLAKDAGDGAPNRALPLLIAVHAALKHAERHIEFLFAKATQHRRLLRVQ
jgi:hypothetical protein